MAHEAAAVVAQLRLRLEVGLAQHLSRSDGHLDATVYRGQPFGAVLANNGTRYSKHAAQTACFDLCNAYMTVYTTILVGGDAVRNQAAVFPQIAKLRLCSEEARRSPNPRARRRSAATRALPARKGALRKAAASRAEPGQSRNPISIQLSLQSRPTTFRCRDDHRPPHPRPTAVLLAIQ